MSNNDSYNTNLAAEFYILSMLHRLGEDVFLTLGNKKAVDIVVRHSNGYTSTIDVKGSKDKTGWNVGNIKMKQGHFIVLVSFLNKIRTINIMPEVYVVPSTKVKSFIRTYPNGRKVIHMGKIRAKRNLYENAWHLIS